MSKLFRHFGILTGFSFDISTIACRILAGNFTFLNLKEVLLCIPPPITYSTDCVTSKTTTKAPIFKRPRFNNRFAMVDEEDVRNSINVNLCMILTDHTGPDYRLKENIF
ncbi:hypothetical protein C1646_773261 [Rhizophagus diaphanus]|nr:hypothetical protein C1646_773261 [Rhizophagus diaphanus] [Rhizophagus sp. MUCL 43196]